MTTYTLPMISRRDIRLSLRKRSLMMNVSEKNMDVLFTVIESGSDGITAREISNKCDMTIYSVRHSLDKLEGYQLIKRVPSLSSAKIKWVSDNNRIVQHSKFSAEKNIE